MKMMPELWIHAWHR